MGNATCSACGASPIHGFGMCRNCYRRWRRRGGQAPTADERFWAKVDTTGALSDYRQDLGPCWLWTAGLDRYGYGKFRSEGKDHTAHKWAYVSAIGPVPTGLTLDHLCRVRQCVNPQHLEPVTNAENVRRAVGLPRVTALR